MPATNYPEFNAAVTELTDRVELLLTDVGKMQSVASVQVAVDKAAEASTSATSAASSATAADGSKTAAAGSATAANTSKVAAASSATAADGSKTASASSATTASTAATNAGNSATAADASKTAAAASATAADGSKTAAAGSATAASTSASTATTKATEAAASATAAANSATSASTAKLSAETARDQAVTAASALTGSLSELGSIDLSSGVYPAKPAIAAFWKVIVGGTAGGVTYGVGDTLVYSKSLDQFYKIDNTESVSSVNGATGAVVITPASISAQPSNGNLTALAGLTGAADRLPYFTGQGALSLTTLTAKARELLASANEAGMRTTLGLGTAAVADLTATAYDSTPGRALKVGDFGVGGVAIQSNDFNAITTQGRYFNGGPDAVGLPYAEYWQVEHLPSHIPTAFSQRATGTGTNNLGRVYTRSTLSGAAGLSQWSRLQQQKDYLVGDSYVECLHAVLSNSHSSITIYTNIPAVDWVMWTIKIEGAAGTYTAPASALIAGYFYNGAPYLPTMTVTAANADALTSAEVGVVDGKITVRISGIGYIPRLAVSAIRNQSSPYGAPDTAYTGWFYGADQTTPPNAVAVDIKRTPVLGKDAAIYNLANIATAGSYEHLAMKYGANELQFGNLVGSYAYLKSSSDNGHYLGTPAYRWNTVFAATGAINTSDARHKTPVKPLSAAELSAAKQLAGEIGAFQWLAAIEDKGPAARQHFGVTVQRVIEVFTAHGLDPFRYGMICHDQWAAEVKHHPEEVIPTQTPAVLDAEGNVIEGERTSYEVTPARDEITREAGDLYSLRMDQLALFLARGQAQRQDALEARIAALEAQP